MMSLFAAAAIAAWSAVHLLGWTPDGASFAYEARLDANGEDGSHFDDNGDHDLVLVVAGADGSVQHVFRRERTLAFDEKRAAGAEWTKAEPEAVGEAWLAAHPLAAKNRKDVDLGDPGKSKPVEIALGSERAKLVRTSASALCGTAKLVLDAGGAATPIAADKCLAPGSDERGSDKLEAVPSPDGRRVAVAWNLEMAWPAGSLLAEMNHGYATVLSPRDLATVDLLDAGAGAKADSIAGSLAKAGFRVGHRSKAQKARPATAIYFTDGHEEDAREAAKLLGVAADAVQKATWKTPFAVTVAAAAQ